MKTEERETAPAQLFGFDRDNFLAGLCIVLWYFASVSTVVLNKWLYQFVDFNYPFALTAIHMITCWLGTYALLQTQLLGIPLQQPEPGFILNRIFPLSFVFCVNITLGNISLQTIPVSFNQTIKAAVPACTVILQTCALFTDLLRSQPVYAMQLRCHYSFLSSLGFVSLTRLVIMGRKLPTGRYWSIGPIVGGVMLATFTEPNYHPVGFWTAAIGCWITATWALLCGVYLKNLNPLNLLFYIAPWAAGQLLVVSFFTEFSSMAAKGPLLEYFNPYRVFLLILSGLFALLLSTTDVASFFVIQKTSSLTYTVAGNFKVAFSIIVSVIIFRNEVTFLNAAGCLITIAGVWWYQSIKELPPSK